MTIEPVHLQIAGIGLIVALGIAMLWWIVTTAIGWHRGKPVYILPEPAAEEDDEGEDGDIEIEFR